jgi:hypothetical protein
MHFLHREFPQGKVTGSWRGYEHCGHCASLTIRRASFEGSSGASCSMVLRLEEEVLERGDRSGRELLLKDINGASTSAELSDCPWSTSVCNRESAQSREVFGEDATMLVI